MLAFKPHSVTVQAIEEDIDAVTGEVGVSLLGTASSAILCKVEPISSDAAFKAFGVDIDRGFRLMCELADADTFELNARVNWSAGGLTLRVASLPRSFRSAIGITDHATVLLRKEDDV